MSNNIKPSEVSEVLLQQLKDLATDVKFEEVGVVLTVGDGVARIYGLTKVTENELLEFENGVMGVAMNLEEDNVGAVLLGSSEGIKEGQTVKRTRRVASILVNDNFVGRVINPLGQPLDGGGEIEGEKYLMPLDRKAPGVIYRQPPQIANEQEKAHKGQQQRVVHLSQHGPVHQQQGGQHHQKGRPHRHLLGDRTKAQDKQGQIEPQPAVAAAGCGLESGDGERPGPEMNRKYHLTDEGVAR